MKNIYEDGTMPTDSVQKGNTANESAGQASAGSAVQPPSVTRPKKHATKPPLAEQAQQQAVPPQGIPMYYTPYGYIPVMPQTPPTQGDASQNIPQGYTPYPYSQFYYPVPPAYPAAAPTAVQSTPSQPSDPSVPNPGTRVLYQSEDFDSPVKERSSVYAQEDFEHGILTEIVSEEEDVSLDGVTFDVKKTPPKVHQASLGVSVDDMEMSTFEFNAMAQRRRSTAKAVKQPGKARDISETLPNETQIEIEEMDELVETDIGEEGAENKNKKISTGEIIRRIVLGVSVIAIVIASAVLINEYRLSKENDELEQDISDLIIDTETTTQTNNEKDDEKDNEDDTTTTEEQTTVLTPQQQWEQIKADYPNVIFPAGLQLKYAKLYAENSDFVGYLSADGANINLPIVQTTDDSYYLDKNFYGKTTKYGCPFVTHLNNIEPLDLNTVIFGHHMNNGTVFGALDKYKTIEGFKAAPVIEFNTLYKDYSWKVIAAFVTNAYEKDDNGYIFRYYFTSLSTEERYSAYLNELAQRSLYDTGVDVLPTDKILTLSTCSHEFTDARFVVVARLVRDGESTEVDVSRATVNSNVRYPQAYYDKKGISNPYKNASQWEVG